MVQIHPPHILLRARGALRRLRLVAIAVACAALAAGCQQGSRFAEGNHDAPPTYKRVSPASEPHPEFDIPPRPVIQEPVASIDQTLPAWMPKAGARPWRWIVIHHSATYAGGALRFDKEHRANGWDELGYHFVIGNGSDTRDGLVEVGPRWVKQKHGAHAKTPNNQFNDYGIGICVVGNFDSGRPSPQQMKALTSLVAHLMQRYNIPANRVIGHEDTGRSTACPGRNLEIQLAGIRRTALKTIAASRSQPEVRTALYATDQR